MNFMPKRKRTFYDESALFSDPDSARQGERLERREGILRSGDSEQLWNVTTFPVNFREFRAPEVCSAAILDCRNIHGIRWVLQEMFSTAICSRKNLSRNAEMLMPGTLRNVLPRYAISELHFGNSQNKITFSVGESASRPKCARRGSMKWRWLDQQTIF